MRRPLGRKLYYSIGEVSELTQLQPYTLRAWEKEFSCLRPRRVRGKNRAYRERDIGIVLLIKRLLYEERYSTRGVRQKLKSQPELIQRAVETAARYTAGSQDATSQVALEESIAAVAATGPGSAALTDDDEEVPPPAAEEDAADQAQPTESSQQLKDWVAGLRQDLEAVIKLLA